MLTMGDAPSLVGLAPLLAWFISERFETVNPGQNVKNLKPSSLYSATWLRHVSDAAGQGIQALDTYPAVIIFSAALLALYCGAFILYMGELESRRLVMEPTPELTLTIRGVV